MLMMMMVVLSIVMTMTAMMMMMVMSMPMVIMMMMVRFGFEDEYYDGSVSWWQHTKPRIWSAFDEPYSSNFAKVIILFNNEYVLKGQLSSQLKQKNNKRGQIAQIYLRLQLPHQLVTHLDDLFPLHLDLCIDHRHPVLYFTVQVTEKYSAAMFYCRTCQFLHI